MRIGTHVYVSAMLAAILLLGISCGEQSDHIQDVESENDNPSPAAESGNPDNGEGDSAGSDTTGEEKEADARHGLSDPEFLARFAGEDLPGEFLPPSWTGSGGFFLLGRDSTPLDWRVSSARPTSPAFLWPGCWPPPSEPRPIGRWFPRSWTVSGT